MISVQVMMKTSLINKLFIDIETFSSIDLSKCGVYKYAESSDFEILLFGYSVDGADVKVVDLAGGELIPPAILDAITNDSVTKYSFNAMFERVCLSRYLNLPNGTYLNPNSWRCHMVWSAYLGLPLSLKDVGKVLKLKNQKMDEGKELIRFFCTPCSPTKSNSGRTRNLPCHAPSKWSVFKTYNKRDVEVEIEIHNRLIKYPVPDFVWDEYHLDQVINDRGINLDMTLVNNAISIDEEIREKLIGVMQSLTELDNPNSVIQLKTWFLKFGIDVDDLGKKNVTKLKESVKSGEIVEVLSLRQQLSKSSVKKYIAMKNARCNDNRAHGMFQFYGANRSGRFSGRLIQLQNLPQNHLPDLDKARELVKQRNIDALKMLYEDIPSTLSELIRTAFIPKQGYKFIVSDFSAIEARVIAWFSKEQWRIDAFKNGADIYCQSASAMFGVQVVKHGINGHLRQKGKVAELACGYGGGVGALTAMGALDMGIKESELQSLVTAWRKASPHIVEFWWAVDRASKKAIEQKTVTSTHGLVFEYKSGMLFITLPSGRKLAYVKPRIETNKFGSASITYEGIAVTKKWERIETYGPKLVENIVQATARDILCYAMTTLKDYRIVAHVHDELIIEAPIDETVEHISSLMSKSPEWCQDLILNADGYECNFYKKD